MAGQYLTLAQLRAFLASYSLKTFTAAATELDVSQASVSELVGRLESELGATLFVRGGRQLAPTAAADELLGHAQRTLAAADDAAQAIRSLNGLESGVVSFGVPRNAGYYGVPDAVIEFHSKHPGVRLRMVGINSNMVARAVLAGELEGGLVVLPVDEHGLDVEPLAVDDVFLATSRRLTGSATLDDLLEPGLILYDADSGWDDPTRRQLLSWAQREGRELSAQVEIEFVDTALRLVAASAGATIVSGSLVRAGEIPGGVEIYPFEPRFVETLALIKRKGAPQSLATAAISDLMRRRIRQSADVKRSSR